MMGCLRYLVLEAALIAFVHSILLHMKRAEPPLNTTTSRERHKPTSQYTRIDNVVLGLIAAANFGVRLKPMQNKTVV